MLKDLIDRSRVELRDWEDAQGRGGQDSKTENDKLTF